MNSTIFQATLEQMGFLLLFMAVGYMLARARLVPAVTPTALSKLENYLFIPALVLNTFITNFTPERLGGTWQLLLFSVGVEICVILISLPLVRMCTKDAYIRKIFLYGLCFSNFGFMGNAIVSRLFPEIFMEYILFTLVLWVFIYMWGAPVLLIEGNERVSIGRRLRSFLNPMFVCMLIGMVIGLCSISLPTFVTDFVRVSGDCMSPVAMLLTGMTIAEMDLPRMLKQTSVYAVSGLRLILLPLLFLGVAALLPLPSTFEICALCSLAMPLGLNTIVIPKAYGKDTSTASGMALISHVLSCITIPLIFLIYTWLP